MYWESLRLYAWNFIPVCEGSEWWKENPRRYSFRKYHAPRFSFQPHRTGEYGLRSDNVSTPVLCLSGMPLNTWRRSEISSPGPRFGNKKLAKVHESSSWEKNHSCWWTTGIPASVRFLWRTRRKWFSYATSLEFNGVVTQSILSQQIAANGGIEASTSVRDGRFISVLVFGW